MKDLRVKPSFTLLELAVVVLIIAAVYFLFITNFNFTSKEKKTIKIENIKEFMLKNFSFEKELSLACIDSEKLPCYIYIDGKIKEDFILENLFKEVPIVYDFRKDLKRSNFFNVEVNDIEYEPFFKLTFDEDFKHKNLLVELDNGRVILFTSISKKVKKYENINKVQELFWNNEMQVRDAF